MDKLDSLLKTARALLTKGVIKAKALNAFFSSVFKGNICLQQSQISVTHRIKLGNI